MKRCNRCGEEKEPTEFHVHGSTKDGLRTDCKDCACKNTRAWKRNYPERHRENNKRWVRKNPARVLLMGSRQRARMRQVPFNLTIDDVVIPDRCPVLGMPLESQAGRGSARGPKDWSPTVDRIDNTRGYEADNVIVVSFRANRIKSDSTPGELRTIADFYDGLRNRKEAA